MKLQTTVDECKENDRHVLENGANESVSSENGQDASLTPIITYSTYHGARRMRRRRSQKKVFRPLNATIAEVDEKSAISLVNQQITNPVKEETNQDNQTMTRIQRPLVEKIPLTNHDSEKNEAQSRIHTARFPSNEVEFVTDMNTENEIPAQQSSFTGINREVELSGQQKEETALRTDTINSTKKQALQLDTSLSNAAGKSFRTDSGEYCTLTGSKLDDTMKQTERTEYVGKGLTQETANDAPAAITKIVSSTEPVKMVHMSNEVDGPKILLIDPSDKCDLQLEDASRTQTNEHLTVSGKDNVTGISTGLFTTNTENVIEEPSREHGQTQRKAETNIKHVNDEQCSEVLEKLMSKNSSVAELMNETKNKDKGTSTNIDGKLTTTFELTGETVFAITSEKASSVINSAGVRSSEAISTIEPQTTAEGNHIQTEKSFYIQKPDQLFKISSEKEHDPISELFLSNQAPLPEPKVSREARLSLSNESIFYRYYQESANSLLGSDNRHSLTNSEIIAESAFKENQFVGEMQDQGKTSDFMNSQNDNNKKAKETNSMYSPSENSLWYRCFQQSSGLSNIGGNAQSDIDGETHLGNTLANEIVHSTKPFALVVNSADGVIQGTSQEYALNDSKAQSEEIAKRINTSENEDLSVPPSVKPRGKESTLKISAQDKEASVQSEAELIRDVCTVDASNTQPVETNRGDTLKERSKETAGKLIFSAVQETPYIQPITTDIKENITNKDRVSNLITIVNVKDTIEDVDLKENNLAVDHTFEEIPVKLEERGQADGERRNERVQPERLEESGNNLIHSAGGEDKSLPLIMQDKVFEYVPSLQNAAKKDSSVMIKSHEEGMKSVPVLPVGISLAPRHAAENLTNQEASTSLTTSPEYAVTESLLKADEDKVIDGQIQTQQPLEETELRAELRNTADGAEDSWPETSSKMAFHNADSVGQELREKVSEQCSIIDPAQSTAILRSDSANLPQSNDFQGNSVADFENKLSNSEEENFQLRSVHLEILKSTQSGDQRDSVNQNTKPKKDGTRTVFGVKTISKYPLLDLVKPINEVGKEMIPKVVLTNKETEANTQTLGTAQVPLPDSGAALDSDIDSARPSEANSAVDHLSSPKAVTPHTQHSNTVISEGGTTIETSSHPVTIPSLKDSAEDVDFKENTKNLVANNTAKEIPEELLKSVQLEVQEEEVMQSEIQQQSENDTMFIAEGENNMNDGLIQIRQRIQGTELRSELRNTVVGAEDSWPETALKIMQSDNANNDTMGQELMGIVSEQCNIIDPALSTAILRTNSATSICSSDFQENSVADLETSAKHAKNENKFQTVSVQLSITGQSESIDQEESTNQNTKSEDGTVSVIKPSSNYIIPELIKPVNEKGRRMVQKMALTSKEITADTQIPGETQLPLPDSGAVLESDLTIRSDVNSAVDHVSSPKLVISHTEHSGVVIGEGDTTVETSSDLITITRLKDAAEDVELKKNETNGNNNAKEIPKELVRTLQVSDVQEKEMMQSEKQEKSENNRMFITEGECEALPLITQGSISEYIPAVLSASTATESQEESLTSAPLLPVDNDHATMEPDPELINYEPITGLLNPTSTINLPDVTALLLKADEDKVSDSQVQIQQPIEGTELRSELRNTVVGAEDSWPETSSNVTKMANHNTDSVGQELIGKVSEQCNIIDPAQISTRSRTNSNYFQENIFADFEGSKSSQFTEHSDFTSVEETERIPEVQATSDLECVHLTDKSDGDVMEYIGEYIGEYLDNENGMEPQGSEQEALILETSLSHSFRRRKFYPFALPPIYEEQDVESEATTKTSNVTHSLTLEAQYNANESVATVLESAATSLNMMQRESKLPEVEEGKENSTSPDSTGEVSTTVSSDHSEKATKLTQDRSEEQNLPVQIQAEVYVVDSNTSLKPMPSAAVSSLLYSYFQLSKDDFEKVKPASSDMAAEVPIHLQQKLLEDVDVLKYPSDSKCPVKNKTLKINPRPGKMVIYDELNFHGNKREIFTDQSDATSWNFSEGLSLNVVRGCWIIYEKPEFQGQLLVLEEGQKELNKLWDNNNICLDSTQSKIVIGSIKRIIKNHCIPEIEIIQEPQQGAVNAYFNGEVASLEECRITPTVSSLVVNSGIWLAYNKSHFCGPYTLLEAGNKPVPVSTEAKSNDIKSLRPLKMGGLKVERPMSPRIVIFEKEMFNGHFKEICKDVPDLKNIWENATDLNMDNFSGAGSDTCNWWSMGLL
ncbi:uncharacterized protein LOC127569384 [Pristis pectinata]|uniref:uncharacterized protein LOC127569384 n=1 Tax=Pristis pectinata TaxID=685728 RepID=UPI00223CAE66|nr:uncharacterized protein LOC127569384 [Pristis pectinata]